MFTTIDEISEKYGILFTSETDIDFVINLYNGGEVDFEKVENDQTGKLYLSLGVYNNLVTENFKKAKNCANR